MLETLQHLPVFLEHALSEVALQSLRAVILWVSTDLDYGAAYTPFANLDGKQQLLLSYSTESILEYLTTYLNQALQLRFLHHDLDAVATHHPSKPRVDNGDGLWSLNQPNHFLPQVDSLHIAMRLTYTLLQLLIQRRSKLVSFTSARHSSKFAFAFLRFIGPYGLPDARKIIANQDGFLITHIGQGSFARIARVWHRESGRVKVMKRMTLDKGGVAEELMRMEIDALESLKGSRWFPSILGSFNDGEDWVLTMPYYGRGDLGALIDHRGFLGRKLAQFYCAELVVAIQFLHKKGYVHRDIKPDNIFLDNSGHLILADLGLAEKIAPLSSGGSRMRSSTLLNWARVSEQGSGLEFPYLWPNESNPFGTRGISGTHWYSAPEIFRAERYSFGVDYWSVAVLYYELVTGHIPFNNFQSYPEDKHLAVDFRRKPNQFRFLTDRELEDITKMLDDDPSKRYQSLSEIKTCGLFRGVDWQAVPRRELDVPLLPDPLVEDNVL